MSGTCGPIWRKTWFFLVAAGLSTLSSDVGIES